MQYSEDELAPGKGDYAENMGDKGKSLEIQQLFLRPKEMTKEKHSEKRVMQCMTEKKKKEDLTRVSRLIKS